MGLSPIQLEELFSHPHPHPRSVYLCVCLVLSSNSSFYAVVLPSLPGDLGMTSLGERKWWRHLDASLTQPEVAQVWSGTLGGRRHGQEGLRGQLGWVSRH